MHSLPLAVDVNLAILVALTDNPAAALLAWTPRTVEVVQRNQLRLYVRSCAYLER